MEQYEEKIQEQRVIHQEEGYISELEEVNKVQVEISDRSHTILSEQENKEVTQTKHEIYVEESQKIFQYMRHRLETGMGNHVDQLLKCLLFHTPEQIVEYGKIIEEYLEQKKQETLSLVEPEKGIEETAECTMEEMWQQLVSESILAQFALMEAKSVLGDVERRIEAFKEKYS